MFLEEMRVAWWHGGMVAHQALQTRTLHTGPSFSPSKTLFRQDSCPPANRSPLIEHAAKILNKPSTHATPAHPQIGELSLFGP